MIHLTRQAGTSADFMGWYGSGHKTVYPAAMWSVRIMGDEIMDTGKAVDRLDAKVCPGQGRHHPLLFISVICNPSYG
jgi:hypothetical protein